LPSKKLLQTSPAEPKMITVQVDAGKKQKIRPGDILGALTGEHGIAGEQVGKIKVFADCTYVAISRDTVSAALKKIGQGKLKGRSYKARRIDGQPTNSRRLARRRSSR
jgi:ATP-independent RNA helicase DbpA